MLPEVINEVNGECDVYIDGGFRNGNDIFKALALGAKAVFIARPVLWGMAYDVSCLRQNGNRKYVCVLVRLSSPVCTIFDTLMPSKITKEK